MNKNFSVVVYSGTDERKVKRIHDKLIKQLSSKKLIKIGAIDDKYDKLVGKVTVLNTEYGDLLPTRFLIKVEGVIISEK